MPTISVIVPVYKVEPYLHQCVDSILNQTFKDFELILVDDGSPDSCPQICDDYAKKDSRVKVIHKENGGLSSARNAGLDWVFEHSNSEYISFVDSDDWIETNLLKTVVSCFKRSSVDGVRYTYNRVNQDGLITQRKVDFGEEKMYLFDDFDSKISFIVNTYLKYAVGFEAWGIALKKSILINSNIRFFDNSIIFAEDIFFSILYTLKSNNLLFIPNALYCYRNRQDSLSHNVNNDYFINKMNNLSFFLYKSTYHIIDKDNYSLIHHSIIYNKILYIKETPIKKILMLKKINKKIKEKEHYKNFNRLFWKNRKMYHVMDKNEYLVSCFLCNGFFISLTMAFFRSVKNYLKRLFYAHH